MGSLALKRANGDFGRVITVRARVAPPIVVVVEAAVLQTNGRPGKKGGRTVGGWMRVVRDQQ